jgi:membrane protein YdbS with pleckstrin-like domain
MQCRQCSAELPAGSAFCNRCGAGQAGASEAARLPLESSGQEAPEERLWTGSYSLKAAIHLWLSWPVWGALFVALYVFRASLPSAVVVEDFELYLAIAAILPGLVLLARALVRKWSLRYRLTTHRLLTERGLLSRRHDELELIRVDDVSVRQSLFQRLVDVGTITLLSRDASNPELEMTGIARPLELKETIRDQVRARRARTAFLENI